MPKKVFKLEAEIALGELCKDIPNQTGDSYWQEI